jgi:hypothetical protein
MCTKTQRKNVTKREYLQTTNTLRQMIGKSKWIECIEAGINKSKNKAAQALA